MEKVIIASGPVIVEGGKVLLDISSQDDFWKFCGGKMIEGKNLRENAIARAKEELGIDVQIKDPSAFVMAVPKPNEEDKDVFLVHYLADYSGEIVPGEMVREWAWLDLNDLPDNLAPNIVPTLRHFGLM